MEIKTIYLAIAPYEWDIHSVLISEQEIKDYDGWEVRRFYFYGDEDFNTSLSNLSCLCATMLETNCQNSWSELLLELKG